MDKGLNPGRSGFPEGLPSAAPEAPPRRRIRGLAVATAVLCIAGHLARGIGGSGVTPGEGPVGQVVAQALWNAAQVGQLLLILSLWSVRRGWLIGLLALATVGLLPFSSYLIGPGGHASTALMLVTCALALRRGRPELEVRITDPVPGRSSGFRFEALAFLCNLLCSLYNYNASWLCWPHWDSLFRRAEGALHITAEPGDVAARLYSMGLPGVELPAYVPSATGSTLGALIFALIWTVLPTLYVLYFAAMFRMAAKAPGARIQQALCLFGIVHFLFLTDIVDYKYGRGILNEMAEWCHWSERFAWRIAILLPIYQKLMTGQWRQGNGVVGRVLHWIVAAWAVVFLAYQVLVYDMIRFWWFVTGAEPTPFYTMIRSAYIQELGYHGALVLMTFLYGYMALATTCNRIILSPAAPARS